jgi:multicomponent Na+:H+ antiporter subunit B
MSSLILQATTRVVHPVLLFASIFFLLSGHDTPGGGFVGGLTAASAYALYAIAFGLAPARLALRMDPRTLVGAGLVLAAAVAALPLAAGWPALKAAWVDVPLPGADVLPLGTPMLFDLGVYLVVLGSSLATFFALAEEAP